MSATGSQAGADWPHLVWTGQEYGIAWRQQGADAAAIYLARLSAEGALQAAPVQIAAHSTGIYPPRLVWHGSGYAAGWIDSRSGGDQVYLARFSPAGKHLGAPIQISNIAGAKAFLRLAWSGQTYGLCWQRLTSTRDVYFVDASQDGPPGAEIEIGSSFDSRGRVDIAARGSDFGVVFGQYRDREDSGHLRFVHLSGEGAILGRGIVGAAEDPFPSLASDGQNFAATWTFDEALRFVRFSPEGESSGRAGATIGTRGRPGEPSLTWNGTGYGVAWVWSPTNGYSLRIRFAPLSDAGTQIGPDRVVTSGGTAPQAPSLVWNGSGYGLAWQSSAESGPAVYFARLDREGNTLGREIRVSQ